MRCRWCNEENDPGARYCTECGRELGDAGTTVPGPPMESNPSMPVSPEERGMGRGGKIALLVIAAIAVVALVVTGTVLVIRAVDARPAAVSEQTDD